MLQLHQKLALGTLGLLFAQGYLGSRLENAGPNYSKIIQYLITNKENTRQIQEKYKEKSS